MCIFCAIANHEIPSSIVYEDEEVMAFLDISQVTKGHTLVIPKQHVSDLLACEPKTLTKVIQTAQLLGNRIMKATGAQGMNVLSNVKEAAGQTVPHFHIHLIPRYDETDACVIEFHESAPQNLEEVLQLILSE